MLIDHFGDREIYPLENAKAIQKNQHTKEEYLQRMDLKDGYSKAEMLKFLAERWVYLTERGATLNNPHIGQKYYEAFTELSIAPNEAQQALREAIQKSLEQQE